MLHQEDEPGELPIKLTSLGVTVADFGLTCAWFSGGGKARFFPMKVSLIVVSHADLLKGSSQVTAPRWGGQRDKPKEPLKLRLFLKVMLHETIRNDDF